MIGLIKQLGRRTPLGWLQLSHDKGRLLVALSGIAFADILMFMQLGFQAALYDTNTRMNRSLRADIMLISPQAINLNNPYTFPRRRLYQAMNVPGVKTAEPFYVRNVTWRHPQTRRETLIRIFGFNPSQPAFDLPEVNQNLDLIKLPDTILFDRGTKGDYEAVIAQVEQGKPVKTEMERRTITIGGLFTVGASFGADGNLITSDQNFLLLFPRQQAESVNVGLLYLQPGFDASQVAARLKTQLPNDVRVLTQQEFVEFEQDYWASGSPIGFIFGLGTAMAFVVGVVIVYQVLSTDVNDHMAEYATFKAMGYRNFYLLGVVFEEAIILAGIGFLPGVGVALGLYKLASNATALPIAMTLFRIVFVLGLTIVMCGMSGAIATRKLQSADPADIF